MTQQVFNGFSSSAFCADMCALLAAESFRQYGYTKQAVYVFRAKSAQMTQFYDDTSSQQKWDTMRRQQAGEMQKIVFRTAGTQGRLTI